MLVYIKTPLWQKAEAFLRLVMTDFLKENNTVWKITVILEN
jgi:hypothetical protein